MRDHNVTSSRCSTSAAVLKDRARLALWAYSDFRGHHQFLHDRLRALGVPHEFAEGHGRSTGGGVDGWRMRTGE